MADRVLLLRDSGGTEHRAESTAHGVTVDGTHVEGGLDDPPQICHRNHLRVRGGGDHPDAVMEAVEDADQSAPDDDVVWLRDDICASALVGPFDVIVDRASLHALTPLRAHAWAATIRTRSGRPPAASIASR